ncbi:CDP-diacylglycerol--serine O-phosphatidyltransferase, partial [Brevundimonas diminuta]|nr:CDP-diacylglycerol--serine O-phosphatidyltransferase [Brevundimonas diminuta]
VISSDPPVALFGLFVGYAVSGYLLWGWRALHGQQGSPRLPKQAQDAAHE